MISLSRICISYIFPIFFEFDNPIRKLDVFAYKLCIYRAENWVCMQNYTIYHFRNSITKYEGGNVFGCISFLLSVASIVILLVPG